MIRHPDMDIASMLKDLVDASTQDQTATFDGHATDQERLDAVAGMIHAAKHPATLMRTLCGACGADVPILESAMCTCGVFVCQACQRIEEEGVCMHERPSFLPARDDE